MYEMGLDSFIWPSDGCFRGFSGSRPRREARKADVLRNVPSERLFGLL